MTGRLGEALETLAGVIRDRDVVTVKTPGVAGSVSLGGMAIRRDVREVLAELERLRACGELRAPEVIVSEPDREAGQKSDAVCLDLRAVFS